MKRVAAILALSIPTIANAQTPYDHTSLILTGFSYHIEKGSKNFNEFNPGLGIEYRFKPYFHASGGFYKNSERRFSGYLGLGTETNGERFVGAGIEAGAVTGYEKPVTPFGAAYIRIGRRDSILNLRLHILPPIVASASVRVNMDKILR